MAILEMKHAKDGLRKLKSKFEIENMRLDGVISAYVSTNQRSKAYMVLKLQRYKREELNKVEGQLSKMQNLIDAVEWQIQSNQAIRSLREGTEILKQLQETISIDELTTILADNDDTMVVEKEYSAIFARELEQAEKETIEMNFDDSNMERNKERGKSVNVFPDVPSSIPHKNRDEDLDTEDDKKKEKWCLVDH
jgi:hypothetical protein